MWLLKQLHLLVPIGNIKLSPITWTVIPAMLCIMLKTIEVVLKVFNLDLTITNQPTGVLLKGILSNKHYFTLTLRITKWFEWLEITLNDQTESVDNLRRRDSFHQYELENLQSKGPNDYEVALFWCVILFKFLTVLIFSSSTHYIYCSMYIISTIIYVPTLFYYILLLLLSLSLLL